MSKERNEERPDAEDEELDSIVVKTKAKGKASDKPAPALRPAKPGRGKRKVREAREREARKDNP